MLFLFFLAFYHFPVAVVYSNVLIRRCHNIWCSHKMNLLARRSGLPNGQCGQSDGICFVDKAFKKGCSTSVSKRNLLFGLSYGKLKDRVYSSTPANFSFRSHTPQILTQSSGEVPGRYRPHFASFSLWRTSVRWARRTDAGDDELELYDAQKGSVQDRPYTVYTLQEYLDREDSAMKTSVQKIFTALDEFTDNPIWMLYALLFLAATVGYVIVCFRLRNERRRFDPRIRQIRTFDQPGGPSIGGPFELIDTNGKIVKDTDLRGKWLYIYFGFSNCPDICPNEMQKLTRMITQLDKKIGKEIWQPVFITVDPERDTPDVLKEYISDFHPRILALTGNLEDIERVARAYRVYFSISDESTSPTDYLVDHSIIHYLMDPEGKFVDYTTKDFNWTEMLSKLLRRIMDYNREQQNQASKKVTQIKTPKSEHKSEAIFQDSPFALQDGVLKAHPST